MAINYIPGKVYLRNSVNGRVYEYEKNLASIANIEQYVPVPVDVKVAEQPQLKLEQTEPVTPEVDTVGHIATGTVAGDDKPVLAKPPTPTVTKLSGAKAPAPKPPAPPKAKQ